MPYCLLPIDGGSPLVISKPVTVLGRAAECGGVVRGYDTVSRRHCEVEDRGHFLEVRDLSSKNGVRINGHRIGEPAALSPGDRLRIGGAEFVLALRSEETIAFLKRHALIAEHDPLSMTQPLSIVDPEGVERDVGASLAEVVPTSRERTAPTSRPHRPQGGQTRSSGGTDRSESPDRSMRTTRRDRATAGSQKSLPPKADSEANLPPREFSQRSWDAIVALERRAPEAPHDPMEKQPQPSDGGERIRPSTTLGYNVRTRAGAAWDSVRLGLGIVQWSMVGAALLLLLLWTGSAAGVFASSAKTCAEVFVPFQTGADVTPEMLTSRGLQVVVIGALPFLAWLFCSHYAEGVSWLAIGVLVIGVLFSPAVQPSRPALMLFVYSAGGIGGLALGCVTVAGLLLASRVPRLPKLALRGVLASAVAVAALVLLVMAFLAEKSRLPTELLPAATPDYAVLTWMVIPTATAALLLILSFLIGIASHFEDERVLESIYTCTASVAAVAVASVICLLAVMSEAFVDGWGDVAISVLAYSVAAAVLWVGQSAGHLRDGL